MIAGGQASLAVAMCIGLLSLPLGRTSPNFFLTVADKKIPESDVTSTSSVSSSCACKMQCLVQPACQAATYTNDATLVDSLRALSEDVNLGGLPEKLTLSSEKSTLSSEKSTLCLFSTHFLKKNDLEESPDMAVKISTTKTISFLRRTGCDKKHLKKGYTLVEDRYCLYFSEGSASWDEASTNCTDDHSGKLASLSDTDLFTAVQEHLQKLQGADDWWVHIKNTNGAWVWGDGTMVPPQSFVDFFREEKRATNGHEFARLSKCNHFFLDDMKDGSETYNYICSPLTS